MFKKKSSDAELIKQIKEILFPDLVVVSNPAGDILESYEPLANLDEVRIDIQEGPGTDTIERVKYVYNCIERVRHLLQHEMQIKGDTSNCKFLAVRWQEDEDATDNITAVE